MTLALSSLPESQILSVPVAVFDALHWQLQQSIEQQSSDLQMDHLDTSTLDRISASDLPGLSALVVVARPLAVSNKYFHQTLATNSQSEKQAVNTSGNVTAYEGHQLC